MTTNKGLQGGAGGLYSNIFLREDFFHGWHLDYWRRGGGEVLRLFSPPWAPFQISPNKIPLPQWGHITLGGVRGGGGLFGGIF